MACIAWRIGREDCFKRRHGAAYQYYVTTRDPALPRHAAEEPKYPLS
jgi:hypothetical protein